MPKHSGKVVHASPYGVFVRNDGGALDALYEFPGVGEAVFRVSNDA